MTSHAPLTHHEILHAAALKLAAPFSAPDLAVTAWQHAPWAFGLRGYEQIHPDFNKILVSLFGRRGMLAKGLLVQVRTGLYRVGRIDMTKAPPGVTPGGARRTSPGKEGRPDSLAF